MSGQGGQENDPSQGGMGGQGYGSDRQSDQS
jgi:hypothetical protein